MSDNNHDTSQAQHPDDVQAFLVDVLDSLRAVLDDRALAAVDALESGAEHQPPSPLEDDIPVLHDVIVPGRRAADTAAHRRTSTREHETTEALARRLETHLGALLSDIVDGALTEFEDKLRRAAEETQAAVRERVTASVQAMLEELARRRQGESR